MKIEITGGRLFDPARQLDRVADLFIEDGRILAIGERPAGFQAERQIEAKGRLVMPGIVDLWAISRSEQRARLATEARAALQGGVTTFCCPPDSGPINDSGSVTSLMRDLAREIGLARVYPIGALTQGLAGEQLSEMSGLKEAGCRLLSNMRRPVKNNRILRRCLEYARTQDITVVFCPQDHSLAADGAVHEGFTGARLGLAGVPSLAETIAVSQLLLMVEDTGVRAHFSQLSTARAVAMIAEAQRNGLPVTADVAIHHLLWTDAVVEGFDSRYHLCPPLRTEADREALRQGVRDGVIQAICSQHQPRESAAKLAPFAETEPGMVSLETLLPLSLQLVTDGVLSLAQAVGALTAGPAQVLGVDLGRLEIGAAADLCVVDTEERWEVTESSLASACKNTALLGQPLQGRVRQTLVAGRILFEAS